jgi:hypothetical protein
LLVATCQLLMAGRSETDLIHLTQIGV